MLRWLFVCLFVDCCRRHGKCCRSGECRRPVQTASLPPPPSDYFKPGSGRSSPRLARWEEPTMTSQLLRKTWEKEIHPPRMPLIWETAFLVWISRRLCGACGRTWLNSDSRAVVNNWHSAWLNWNWWGCKYFRLLLLSTRRGRDARIWPTNLINLRPILYYLILRKCRIWCMCEYHESTKPK